MRPQCLKSRGGALTPYHERKEGDHESIQEDDATTAAVSHPANGITPANSHPELQGSRKTNGFLPSKPVDLPQFSLYTPCKTSKEVMGRQGDKDQCQRVRAHVLPLQDKGSSSPLQHYSLLQDLNPTFSSAKTNAHEEYMTSIERSPKGHCTSHQVKRFSTTQTCKNTRIQDQDDSGGPPSISYLEQSSPPLPRQPSIDAISAGQGRGPLTDDEIKDFIVKRVENYRQILASENHSAYHKKDVVALEDISGRHSTEYPNLMVQLSTTCPKDEGSTPLIHPTVPELSVDVWTEKQSGHKKDNPKSVTVNQDANTKRKDADSVSSQMDFGFAHIEKLKEPAYISENDTEKVLTVGVLKDDQYEDISDDEMSQCASNLPNMESKIASFSVQYEDISGDEISQGTTKLINSQHEEVKIPGGFEDRLYEDISEDENPKIGSITVEKPFLKQTPGSEKNKLKFEEEVSQHVQSKAQLKTGLGPRTKVSPEGETVCREQRCSEVPKCDSQRKSETLSCCFSLVLEDDEGDIDDNWICVPIELTDLKFEPEDIREDGPEKVAPGESETGNKDGLLSASKPLSVCPLEIFDTLDSFRQAKVKEFQNRCKVTRARSPTSSESLSLPQDDSATEDSDNYSSGSEHNILTVSKQVFKKKSSINKVKDARKGQARNFNKLSMQKLKQLITKVSPKRSQHKTKQQKKSDKEDIISLDSDTDSEINQKCKKRTKQLLYHSSEDSSDASVCYSSPRGLSPISVDSSCEDIEEKSLEPSEASQCQSQLHNARSKVVMKTMSSNLSHASERRRMVMETKVGSEKVEPQTTRQTISTKDTIISLDSDSDLVDNETCDSESSCSNINDQNFKKESIESLISTETSDSDDDQCVQQRRHSLETVKRRCANGNIQKGKQSSADKEAGKLMKATGGSAHVDPMAERKTFSEKRQIAFRDSNKPTNSGRKTRLSSGSDDTGQNPVIPRYVFEPSQSKKCLHLTKEKGIYDAKAYHTPLANCKKANSPVKDTGGLDSNKKERIEAITKSANDGENPVHGAVAAPKLFSRQMSSPCQECPSSPTGSLPSTSGQLSEARQSSASSSHHIFKQGRRIARQRSLPPLQDRLSSHQNPSTSDPIRVPLTCPTIEPSARKRLKQNWEDSHFPTKMDRKRTEGAEEVSPTTDHPSSRKRRRRRSGDDRPPRRRHKLPESQTALMKKTKSEAQQWTRDRIRETQNIQSHTVGEGYKWAVKPRVANPRKRFRPEPDELTYSS